VSAIPRIAIAFEFNTLNGGERSMLAALDQLRAHADFIALAPPGGRLAEALLERGIEHHELEVRDSRGSRLPRESILQQMRLAVREIAADLLHANSLSMGRLTGALANHLPIPCVAHLRDIIGLSRAAAADLNRNCALAAVSQATRDFHVAQRIDAHRVRVIHNGVDCVQFAPRPASGSLRLELGLDSQAFLVATVGQIGLRKGQDTLAEAAALISARLPDVNYVLIGERNSAKAESVEFEAALQRRFDETNIAGRLHRLGYRDDIEALLNGIDLLIHPARQEPFGRVLLEAAASGCAIVATRVGGTEEILQDGESARLIPPDRPEELAAAIIELHGNRDLRRRLGENARRRVSTCFPVENMAGRLWRLWSELL
jgi:glycosyltransferase involved in cell wall biosynthesis